MKQTNFLYYATGLSVILSFDFVVGALAFHEIPKENRVATFFGSSKRDHEPGTTIETETYTKNETP
jgi:hypothetical protein